MTGQRPSPGGPIIISKAFAYSSPSEHEETVKRVAVILELLFSKLATILTHVPQLLHESHATNMTSTAQSHRSCVEVQAGEGITSHRLHSGTDLKVECYDDAQFGCSERSNPASIARVEE